MIDGTLRANMKVGSEVNIVLKKDQRSGALTHGFIKDFLTKVPKHHRGIKVRLQDGQIGRVHEVLDADEEA